MWTADPGKEKSTVKKARVCRKRGPLGELP